MGGKYILAEDGRTPVLVEDIRDWARWFETAERTLARTNLGALGEVSTVFLATDHSYSNFGPPVLWETMVFGGPFDQEHQWRDTSWVRAAARHRSVCRRLRKFVAKFHDSSEAAASAYHLGDEP